MVSDAILWGFVALIAVPQILMLLLTFGAEEFLEKSA